MKTITNFLTIDVEDYFQVHALSKVIKPEDWNSYECRVEKNTLYILDLLNSYSSTQNSKLKIKNSLSATFFILGWIAERYPDLVKEIHRRGHEIASHGYHHQVIYNQTQEEFREDIKVSKKILEDIIGEEVIGYRAPTYSINEDTLWALKVIAEEGYKYDSSVFPVRHDYYGMPSAPRFPFIWNLNGSKALAREIHVNDSKADFTGPIIQQYSQLKIENSKLKILPEFPLSTHNLFNYNFPWSGGGYFRLLPYLITRFGLKRINGEGKPFIFYLHPWELDPNIPVIKNLSPLARFRTYVNLDKTESRFKKLISQFRFSSIKSLYNNLFC